MPDQVYVYGDLGRVGSPHLLLLFGCLPTGVGAATKPAETLVVFDDDYGNWFATAHHSSAVIEGRVLTRGTGPNSSDHSHEIGT